jgi:hypothetical protein
MHLDYESVNCGSLPQKPCTIILGTHHFQQSDTVDMASIHLMKSCGTVARWDGVGTIAKDLDSSGNAPLFQGHARLMRYFHSFCHGP